jgi:hypothetical protein
MPVPSPSPAPDRSSLGLDEPSDWVDVDWADTDLEIAVLLAPDDVDVSWRGVAEVLGPEYAAAGEAAARLADAELEDGRDGSKAFEAAYALVEAIEDELIDVAWRGRS